MGNGTPAIPAYYAALPGLRIVREIGVNRIRAASRALTSALLDAIDRRGFTTIAVRDPDRLAGTVAVDVPEALAVARTLNARDFVVDYRPGVGIRLSPHFYNTRDEIDAVIAEIARIVERRDYADVAHETPVTSVGVPADAFDDAHVALGDAVEPSAARPGTRRCGMWHRRQRRSRTR